MATAPTAPQRELSPADLPEGFVLGTSTSAPQIEGAARAAGKGPSIWDVLAARAGAIADGSDLDEACDHWNRWEQDLDLLADLGVDAYRFSIAWPRIQPEGVGAPLGAGLDFYDQLVDGLLERGITPNVTLYHWDLPHALEDAHGGWRHRDTAGRFADYAGHVGERLADRVGWWATLNEPWCSAFLGYERGVHAPGVQDEAGSVRAAHHLLLGHGLGTQALRAAGAQRCGIVLNLSDARPWSDAPGDVDAAQRFDAMQNRYWLGALAGDVDEDVTAAFGELLELEELVRDGDDATIAEPLDYLGVNTYCPTWLRAGDDADRRPPGPALDGVEGVPPGDDDPGNMMGWWIDASCMSAVLHLAHERLPDLPLMVTENGMPSPDEVDEAGTVDDAARVAYLNDHLAAALQARAEGVPVEGYFAWSLMDNFEWAEGYGPRFGLVHVDFATQQRTPKRSFHWLAELADARG